MYKLIYTDKAKENLTKIKKQGLIEKARKIKQTLDKLSENPRHPGLHTHKNNSFKSFENADVFQSYVENRTPDAYRVFWHYGFEKDIIIIDAIIPHP